MATITGKLVGSATGLIKDTVNDQLFDFTIPGVTAAELESAGAVIHLPGESPSSGVLLKASNTVSLPLGEKLGATLEIDVKD